MSAPEDVSGMHLDAGEASAGQRRVEDHPMADADRDRPALLYGEPRESPPQVCRHVGAVP